MKCWVLRYIQVYGALHVRMTDFDMTGVQLCKLTEEEFCQRADKQIGEKMFEDLAERKKGGLK